MHQDEEGVGPGRHPLRPYLTLVLVMPLVASTLGIDAGAVFQIVAVEELGLSARAVGVAFGLGVLSVPLQLYARRMPLWRAKRNLRLFFAFATAGCLGLAAIVGIGRDARGPALGALALTVCAEVVLSVLYATAWQPLASYGLSSQDRQNINARGRAAGGLVLAAALVVFGLLPAGGRVLFIVLVAGGAAGILLAVRRLAGPEQPPAADPDQLPLAGSSLRAGVLPIYLALGVAGFAGWPLFLIYSREVLWPGANLGLLGAVQLTGSMGAALAWRPASGPAVRRRVRGAAGTLAVASTASLLVDAPVVAPLEAAVVLLLLVVAAASTTTILLSLMELAHRAVSEESSVRALTLFDVVGSTTFQASVFIAGLLVEASTERSASTDPYRLYLAVVSVGLLGFVLRLRAENEG